MMNINNINIIAAVPGILIASYYLVFGQELVPDLPVQGIRMQDVLWVGGTVLHRQTGACDRPVWYRWVHR